MLSQLHEGPKVCLLRKTLYRLRQAGRRWHLKLHEALKNAGLIPTNADPYIYVNEGKIIFLFVYVDDILIASKDCTMIRGIIEILKSWFVKDLEEAKCYLGIEILKNRENFCLSQFNYIKNLLMKFGMAVCKTSSTPMANGNKLTVGDSGKNDNTSPYRELVGSLMYLALGTRPDIAHTVSVLSQFNCSHEKKHWIAARHVLRYLKNTVT